MKSGTAGVFTPRESAVLQIRAFYAEPVVKHLKAPDWFSATLLQDTILTIGLQLCEVVSIPSIRKLYLSRGRRKNKILQEVRKERTTAQVCDNKRPKN